MDNKRNNKQNRLVVDVTIAKHMAFVGKILPLPAEVDWVVHRKELTWRKYNSYNINTFCKGGGNGTSPGRNY